MLLDQMNELRDARLIKLPKHAAANGDGVLVAAETAQQVPFQIQGMFTIVAPAGAKRGQHAHRLCSQFMVCVKAQSTRSATTAATARLFRSIAGNWRF